MKKTIVTIICTIVLFCTSYGQNNINGFVVDSETGEPLINANVYDTISNKYSITNQTGYFNISTTDSILLLKCSYVGYKTTTVLSYAGKTATIKLVKNNNLTEIIIRAGVNSTQRTIVGIETLTPQVANQLPSIMGEPDIIKNLSLMPGVSFGGELAPGYFVRGGSNDQNLILIDEVPVYNPYHLYGYFSVINSDAVNNVSLYKAAVPVQHSGRLSSVLDIAMRQGNNKKVTGMVSLSNIAGKALVEGPLFSSKSTFLVTARRSFIDLTGKQTSSILNAIGGLSKIAWDIDVPNYYFFDLNIKLTHNFTNSNKLSFSFYQSTDQHKSFEQTTMLSDNFKWGNKLVSINWAHLLNKSIYAKFVLYVTKYNYLSKKTLTVGNEEPLNNDISFYNNITDISAKYNLSCKKNNHLLTFGSQYIYQKQELNNPVKYNSYNNIDTVFLYNNYNNQLSFYFSDDIKITRKMNIIVGLNSFLYLQGEKLFPSVQPRLSISYNILSGLIIKSCYNRMVQPIHLLSTSWAGKSTDIWLPASNSFKPQVSDQLCVATEYCLNRYSFTADVFYKTMNNLVDYKNGTSFVNNIITNQIVTGTGKAYGVELSVKKEHGVLSGIISYTYSRSTRKFKNLNNNEPFDYTYQRPHDLSVALIYKTGPKFSIGANWVFASGQPVTISQGIYSYYSTDLQNFLVYNQINNARLPNYHRLDLSVNYKHQFNHFNYSLGAGVYNVYNRQNPYSVFETDGLISISSLLNVMPFIKLSLGFN